MSSINHIHLNYNKMFPTIFIAHKIAAAAEIWSPDQLNFHKMQLK